MTGRALLSVLAVGAVGAVGGCTAGSGTGSAVGTLQVIGCNSGNTLEMPSPYSLNPTFFAGEPIEDVCPKPPGDCSTSSPHTNRLVIRMQRTGNGVEVNDTLIFNINNSLKVAQCVRGKTVNGAPTWDTRVLTAADGSPIPGVPWCDWNAADQPQPDGGAADGGVPDAGAPDAGAPDGGAGGADGGVTMTATAARINLSTQDYVQAGLSPLYTCVEARSVAVALPGSWIEFQDFGLAIQSNLPPEQRGDINGDFKVDFGQRLRATFHLVLGDQAVENAIKTHMLIPDPLIGGTLDGSFDFDLDRGRAAQPFP